MEIHADPHECKQPACVVQLACLSSYRLMVNYGISNTIVLEIS